MNYGDYIFPANEGIDTIAELAGRDFTGVSIVVEIENLNADTSVFDVYATYEQADHCRFGLREQS